MLLFPILFSGERGQRQEMFNLHGIVLCANFMPPYYQGARYTLCGEAALEDNGLRGAGGVPFTPLPPDAPHHAPLCHRKIPGARAPTLSEGAP